VWAKRVKDLTAAWLVGNGVLLLIAPRQRVLLWVFERPEWVRKAAIWWADHPTLLRLRGVLALGIGMWLALKQYEETS
jgi:hypothetical protein